jgi:predicted component of type VI protein secretion system
VWIDKSQAVNDSARAYHLVARDGKPAREVRVRGYWSRVLAVNGRSALVADPDSTGFRLTEAPLPPR